ncbi:murein biosynthesis integral membrane protein MurJ [Rothia mucilaginosa]|uniref:murein biosynthesis integral membrane protein MurJ n=1 Tax=Rothia mucilaginosa TaxID=43675 RepID=UPI0026E9C7E6|nr:lipid II flippase MurJ [Rothia mucilaginosa]
MLAGSSTFGVIMQALVLFIPLRKLGLRLKPDFAWRGIGLRAASKLAAWTLASGIISNLAFLYMTKVAAGIVGQREHYAALGIQIPGLQALNYASMLYMLPHGVIGISIATVLFNRMSASAIADDSDSVIYALSHGLRNAAVATVFCMVALMVLAGPVAVLFSGGDPIAATIIAKLIVITALGTPTLTINYLYSRVLYAREDARTPFRIQVYSAIIMVIMSFAASLLDAQYTVYMLAFIYPVHNILIMFISHHMVRRRLGYYGQRGIVSAYARTTLASLFAGGIAAIALWLLGGYQLDGFAWASKLTAIITLAVCGTVMGLAYLAGIQIFRVKEANALLAPSPPNLSVLPAAKAAHNALNRVAVVCAFYTPRRGPQKAQATTRTPQTITQPQHPSMPGRI